MFRSKTKLARFAFYVVVAAWLSCMWTASADVGMPALLPSSWTAENSPDRASSGDAATTGAVALRVQAISFFLAMFLLSGWLVKGLWNLARRDFPMLPVLSFGRSLALVTLWGLAFVVVLTMISGTRELLTCKLQGFQIVEAKAVIEIMSIQELLSP